MKRNKYALLVTTLCVISLPMYGMGYINKAGKIIGMALTVSPSLVLGGSKTIGSLMETNPDMQQASRDSIEKEYPQLAPSEAGNIHTIIKECGVNPHDVDIRLDEKNELAGPMAATAALGGKNYLLVQKDALTRINGEVKSSLTTPKKWYAPLLGSKESLAVCLRHEVGHIVRGDARLGKRGMEELSAGGAIAALTWLIQKRMPMPTSVGTAIVSGAAYIGMGYLNAEKVIPTIVGLQQRARENAAEKFAFQHTKNAQELRTYADACEKIGVIHEKKDVQSWAQFLHWPHFEQHYYNLSGKNQLRVLKAMNFFDEHPAMLERASWARQAADKLESETA